MNIPKTMLEIQKKILNDVVTAVDRYDCGEIDKLSLFGYWGMTMRTKIPYDGIANAFCYLSDKILEISESEMEELSNTFNEEMFFHDLNYMTGNPDDTDHKINVLFKLDSMDSVLLFESTKIAKLLYIRNPKFDIEHYVYNPLDNRDDDALKVKDYIPMWVNMCSSNLMSFMNIVGHNAHHFADIFPYIFNMGGFTFNTRYIPNIYQLLSQSLFPYNDEVRIRNDFRGIRNMMEKNYNNTFENDDDE